MNCPGALDIPLVYGYMAATVPPVNGTIVLLPGSGGTNANDGGLASFIGGVSYNHSNYPNSGYNVVQMAWGSDQNGVFSGVPWEDTTNNCTVNCNLMPPHSILAAACRPATFLKYISGSSTFHSTGGMCAQGFSGGSGAVAYALAWYGGSSWLDKVELLSGPVFSDIGQGCEVPARSGPTICQNNPAFCEPLGPGIPQPNWEIAPIIYIDSVVQAMQRFTGDGSCVGGSPTTQTSYNNWESMSIVQRNASYDYPQTDVTGFSCGSTPDNMNNSSTQAWTFFKNALTTASPNNAYYLYEVQDCPYSEGVFASQSATVPGVQGSPDGYTAILTDMTAGQNGIGKCVSHH